MSIQRDYKPASAWQRRRRAVRRHGLLVITLVLIGLFGGLLAYIRGDRHQQAPTAATPPAAPAQSARGPVAPTAAKVVAPEPAPAPVKPKYDFYTELPKRQVDIQQEEINPRAAPPRQPPARTQPATEPPLRKPAAPPKPGPAPTMAMASASGAKPGPRPGAANPPRDVASTPSLASPPGIAGKTQ